MLDYLQARIHQAAFPADDARFRERVDVRHEWQRPVATAHGSVLRALRRLSGSIRSLPLTVLYCAPCAG
jgi:hypothetical protein